MISKKAKRRKTRKYRKSLLPPERRSLNSLPSRKLKNKNRQFHKTILNQKQKIQQLTEKESDELAVLNAFDGMVYLCSADYKIEFANQAFRRRFGHSQIGKLCYHNIYGRKSVCPWCPNKRVFRGETVSFEVQNPKDGCWFDVVNKPFRRRDGTCLKLAFYTDITERKRSETVLRESEEKFRSVTEQSPNMIFINQGGKVVYANRQCQKIMGYKIKEFYASRFNFLSLIHPDDRGVVLHNFHAHQQGKEVAPHEYKLVTKDREILNAILATRLINYRRRKAILGVITDITERKKASEILSQREAYLSSIIENQPGMVWLKDKESRLLAVNQAFAKMAGRKGPEEVVGKTDLDFWPPKMANKFRADDRKVMKTREHIMVEELISKKGVARWHETFKTPVLNTNGKVIGTTGYARDITARRQVEEALRESEEKLRLFVAYAPVAIAMFDNNMKYITASRRWFTDYGLKNRNIIGRSHYEVFPEIPERWKRIHLRCLKGAVERSEADPFVRTNGHTDWICWEIRPWKKVDGSIGGLIMFTEIITGRKQAEERLRESEERFRNLFENSKDAMMTLEPPSWRFTSANVSMVRMFKAKNRADLCSYSPWELSPKRQPDGRASDEKAKEMIRKAILKGSHFFEWTHRQINGETFFAEVLLTKVRREGGIFLQATVRDITGRKRAEDVVRQSQKRLRNLIDGLGPSIFVGLMATDGTLIEANRPALEAAGLKPEDVLGKPFEETYWWAYSEEVKQQLREAISRAMRGKASRYDVQIRLAENQFAHIDFSLQPLRDEDGKIVFLVPSANIITERKQAEEALRENRRQLMQIIDTVPHMIFAKDEAGRLLLVNRAVGMMYGMEPERLVGKKRQDVHPVPEESERSLRVDRQVLDTGKPVLITNDTFTDVAGGKHVLQTVKIPFDMAGLKTKAILGVSVDVTEQKKIEEFRNEIVRTVSHELRTPLSIEKEGISLLLDGVVGPVNPEQKEILETVMRSIDRLSRMITSLLDISSIETGRIKLAHEMMDLTGLVKDVAFEFKKRASEKNISISKKFPERTVLVLADPDKITQALSNLVDNAVKFTPEGGAVEISVDVLKDAAECSIRDTGIGIAQEDIPKVFEKFQQFSRTAGPGEKGFGLGLSITKGIIEMHGGRIWATSELGKGTQITFTLPFHPKDGG